MQTFELRLESPDSPQARIISVAADNEQGAREQALAKELKIVEFSLLPPERDVWEQPPGSHKDDPDALVDLRRWDAYDPAFAAHAAAQSYDEAVSLAHARLNDWTGRVNIDNAGKVRSRQLGKHSTARLLAHHQVEPYTITEVREVTRAELDAAAAGADGMRELVRLARKLSEDADPQWDPAGWTRIFEALRDMGAPMNAVTAALHGVALTAQDSGATPIVWGTGTGGDDIFAALLTGYTANVDTHNAWDDVSGTEITGTGYTTNGVELAGKTSTYDTGTDQNRLDANDAAWTTSTLSTTDAAIVDRTPGTDATRPVLGSIDFGGTVTTTAGTMTLAFDATGVVVRDYT